MIRVRSTFIALLALGCAGGGAYALMAARADLPHPLDVPPRSAQQSGVVAEPVASTPQPISVVANKKIVAAKAPPLPAPSAEAVAQWLIDAEGSDADRRAAAIIALAGAPKAEAVPVLQKIIKGSVDQERQLALGSLHALALRQGDGDDEIRTVLRLTIYDGDEGPIANSAQAVLDNIESDPDRIASNPNR